jgi:hypothetical protein
LRRAGGHALAAAALVEEVALETGDLPIEEVIGLVDQANENVRHDLGWARLNEGAEIFKCNSSLSPEPANAAGFF